MTSATLCTRTFQCHGENDFFDSVQRFWQQEEVTPPAPPLSSDEREALKLITFERIAATLADVDDILMGASSLDKARDLQEQLSRLCMAGEFPLRKWSANSPSLIADIPSEYQTHGTLSMDFSFSTGSRPFYKALQGVGWDFQLNETSTQLWQEFQSDLQKLEEIRVPRYLPIRVLDTMIRFYGFADASEQAYVAIIYMRIHTCGEKAETLDSRILRSTYNQILLSRYVESTGTPRDGRRTWQTGFPKFKPSCRRLNGIIFQSQAIADYAFCGVFLGELIAHSLWWQGSPCGRAPSVVETDDKVPKSNERRRTPSGHRNFLNPNPRNSPYSPHETGCFGLQPGVDGGSSSSRGSLQLQQMTGLVWRTLLRLPSTKMLVWIRKMQAEKFESKASSISEGESNMLCWRTIRNIQQSCLALLTSLCSSSNPATDGRSMMELTLEWSSQDGTIRQQYWILQGRRMVKAIQRCVTCVRWRTATPYQIMGNLPRSRVVPAKPFFHTGVDYAGPI
ncbi:uncharacterized protein LOC126851856 [Cataglyphis hispanica]|uniref:uncharacterized protein LOC126851856 n=1 Tax=Cataglyphis hispanica TaxID=1086592 RepID=UPI002180903A|nr:uncharacterized protein LOC126851856 [Cataglyphis hispanica]